MKRIEHNVTTGEITEIELTSKEVTELVKKQNKTKVEADLRLLEAEANATAKAALLAKLGITAEEAQLLLGGN